MWRWNTKIYRDHKDPEVLGSDERKQSVIEETSIQTEQKPQEREDQNDSLRQFKNLQDEDEFLEAIRNNDQKVEEMIRNKKIPKKSIMKVVIKQDGYSKGVQLALREMSKLLNREIPQAADVWCGHTPEDPHSPVFVVTLKDQKCILAKNEIQELFIDYTVIIRHKYVPNDEEKSIVEHCGSKSVRSEDVGRVNNCIATHTESLMKEHSNLSIIRSCSVKSCGYLRKEMKVKEDTCIVFNVPVKGIIPFGEKEFPTVIDGIVTDVREGEFLFFGAHNAMKYHPKLRIGCCIAGDKIGSLGGFVDLPDQKIGCLTSAHVVLTEKYIEEYKKMGDDAKRKQNDAFAQGIKQIEIHQPKPEPSLKPFGKVHSIALDAGNFLTPSVDAAIIQITVDERKPEDGNFPDGDFENVGFTKKNPMLYTSGGILNDIEPHESGSLVIKFGCMTGITRGFMEWIGTSVRPVNAWGVYCFPIMWGQFEVKNVHNFAVPGDSGSLVFLCLGGNIRNLHAVGMVMGGSSTGLSCFNTPIKAVFEKLGLKSDGFKMFPSRQWTQEEAASQPLTEHINAHEHALSEQKSILDRLSKKVDTIENSMNQGFGRVGTLEENMTEHLMRVEQNMNDSMNKSLMRIEQNVNESMNERLIGVEQNMNESMNKSLRRVEQNMNENMNLNFNRIEELLKNLSGNTKA